MDLWEIRFEIPAAAAEEVDTLLLEEGEGDWSLLEDAIAHRAWLVGIFSSRDEAVRRWTNLVPRLPQGLEGEPEPRHLPDSDWRNSYRAHFKAWTFGRLHWVPVWERDTFELPDGHRVLWLDPGMAFGTGNHETTRLCIERLVAFEQQLVSGGSSAAAVRVIDAGCGSGILALSASLLGFRDVRGFDNDPEAIKVSVENAELNQIASAVRFETAGLPEGLGSGEAGVVLANIQSDILVRNTAALVSAVAPGGLLALSGILATEAGRVTAAFEAAAPGWAIESRPLGEWCDVALRRPLT